MSTSASLGERRADIDGLDAITGLLLFLMRDGVSSDETAEAATVQVLNGLAGENAVDHDGIDLLGAVLHHSISSLDERSAGVSHIVDNDGDLVLDVTDEDHSGDFVGAGAFLVDQSELEIESVRDSGSTG